MAFNAFERTVAWRYLRARREEGFVSVIVWFSLAGIALGVATLIIVMSVMNGFRADLLTRILGLDGHVVVSATDGRTLKDYDSIATKIRAVPGVVETAPVVEGQVMAIAHGLAAGVRVRAMRSEDLRRRPTVAGNIVAGTLDNFAGGNAIVVGARFAARYGVGPGDTLRLISPRIEGDSLSGLPRTRTFKVVALFATRMTEYDSGYAFMPLAAGQSYFRTGADAVTGIEAMVADPARAETVQKAIAAVLPAGVKAVRWQEARKSFVTALRVERVMMFLILTLMILIAAFNILTGLIMLVKEKGRGIAILRTIGVPRGAVLRIFLLSGASVGIAGTLAGFALGLLLTLNLETIQDWTRRTVGAIPFITDMPCIVQASDVVSITMLALTLSVVATLYPAWRAARLDPVEALRYE